MREAAMTCGLVRHRAQVAAGSRVRQGRRKIRGTAVLLLVPGRVIVAQAQIEREFARHLPAVLSIESPLLFSKSYAGRRIYLGRIYRAKQETGIRQSDMIGA